MRIMPTQGVYIPLSSAHRTYFATSFGRYSGFPGRRVSLFPPVHEDMKTPYTTILTIAGSDSIAGAGIQGDIRTSTLCDVFALTAVTCVTAQNTQGVSMISPVAPDVLRRQIDAVASDCTIDAVKIGMLPTPELVEVVAEAILKYKFREIVIDPIATPTLQGDCPDAASAYDALTTKLIPLSTLVTPNFSEAQKLLGTDTLTGYSYEPMELAARICEVFKTPAALVKGCPTADGNTVDALYQTEKAQQSLFCSSHIDTTNTHGTGCAMSTAIACALARRHPMAKAVAEAERLVHLLIEKGVGYQLGNGEYGPLGFLNL